MKPVITEWGETDHCFNTALSPSPPPLPTLQPAEVAPDPVRERGEKPTQLCVG